MSDVEVRLLDRSPRIGPLLARAVATSRGRAGARGRLPGHRLMLRGVEQDVRRLAGYAEVTGGVLAEQLPTTWLHVLTFPLQVELMAAKDFPFPMVGMVHVANSMTQHRPVTVGEELTLSTWADRLAPHRKGSTVELHGEARVGDEVVWTGRSTYLVRGPAGSPGAEPAAEERLEGAHDEEVGPQEGHQEERRHEEDRLVLPATELATWRLPKDLGRRYAAVSGDANPIHLTAVTAKALGFPRAIAHGMWTHARALAAVQPRLPGSFTVDAEFVKPVLLPSTVVLRGRMEPRGGALAVTSRDGSKVHMTMQVHPA